MTNKQIIDSNAAADFIVTVKRGWFSGWRLAKYHFSDIRNLRWSNMSGGVNEILPRTTLMGYVWCDGMLEGELDHSCRHGRPPHEILVCLFKTHNRENWHRILAAAPDAP